MGGPIFALARAKTNTSIGSHVTNVTDPAIDAPERVVSETALRLVKVVV